MSLIIKLASRNLLQDRLRFVATIIGIVFSIVLVMIQMGLFLSFERMVTTMIDHAQADLWIAPFGTKCFEDPSLLDERDRAQALAVPGVVDVIPVVIGFTEWAVPSGGTTPVFIIGSTASAAGLHPWNFVKGNLGALSVAHAVAIDQTHFGRLGVTRIGDSTEIREQKAEVAAMIDGIIPAVRMIDSSPGRFPNRLEYGSLCGSQRFAGSATRWAGRSRSAVLSFRRRS